MPPVRRVIQIPKASPVLQPAPPPAIRTSYAEEGVDAYYETRGSSYQNPHAAGVQRLVIESLNWGVDTTKVLDLACGAGEVSLALLSQGLPLSQIDACDPYTALAYEAAVGARPEPWRFVDLCQGVAGDRRWSLIIASFALHLCPPSLLPVLIPSLAQHCTGHLLVLTPHKRPILLPEWGFLLVREDYDTTTRVRARLYSRA